MRALTILGAVLGLLAAGCGDKEHFVIEVTPQGDAVERSLTCWHTDPMSTEPEHVDAFPQAMLEEIAAVYGAEAPKPGHLGGKHAFRAKFRGTFQNEAGGTGHYARGVTPLGSVYVWSETLRGEVDPLEARRQRETLVDRYVEFLAGFVRHELGEGEDADRMTEFVRTDLRDDVLRFLDLLWLARTMETMGLDAETTNKKTGPWLTRFLVDRGYLDPLEMAGGSPDMNVVLEGVARKAARRVGWKEGEPLPAAVSWLVERADARLKAYCETLPAYQEKRKAWEAAGASGSAPDPEQTVLAELSRGSEPVDIGLFEAPDSLELTLHVPVEPLETTGDWDADASVVRWKRELPEGFGLPLLCDASWVVPDETWQETHLGRVVLGGTALVEYTRAHLALGAGDAAHWTSFLERLEPGPDLVDRVEAFSFGEGDSGETPEVATRLANALRAE